MSLKPKGGRGKQAPYQTKTMRVPLPLVTNFENQINEFRDIAINGIDTQDNSSTLVLSRLNQDMIDRNEAIEKAKKIIKQKRNAKISLVKLLQVIYNDKSIKVEDLIND